jgi:hypothetical protein
MTLQVLKLPVYYNMLVLSQRHDHCDFCLAGQVAN